MSTLVFICQRIPFLSHIIVFFIAWYGPNSAPLFYSAVYLAIHLMMHAANWQTMWGAYSALVGVIAQSKGDWRHKWADKPDHEVDLERMDTDGLLPADVEHVVIIPNYKEDVDVLRETLDCLASHPAARYQYRICLAMEAREEGSADKAARLISLYSHRFKAMVNTSHPGNLPGEAVGKASNVNWAARQVAASSPSSLRARQILTIIDSDIFIAADFFERAAIKFTRLTLDERTRIMFLLPIVFDRNSDQVPRGVRSTDVMWALAGMSTLYPTSMIKIPTSAYAVSMDLAVRIGFWDAGPEGIGEDFHMLCKSMLSTGTLITETIYSPASVTDVVGSEHGDGWRGWVSDVVARYRQAVRHLWGSLDTGYVIRRLIAPRDDAPAPRTPSADSAATAVELDAPEFDKLRGAPTTEPRLSMWMALALLCKCYQAHLMLVHFFIFLTLPQLHYLSPPSVALCHTHLRRDEDADADPLLSGTVVTLFAAANTLFFQLGCRSSLFAYYALEISRLIRLFSVVATIVALFIYHFYRRHAVMRFRHDPRLGARPGTIYNPSLFAMLDYTGIPMSLAFSVVPAIYSHIMHLFTNRLTYTVSFKPRVVRHDAPKAP